MIRSTLTYTAVAIFGVTGSFLGALFDRTDTETLDRLLAATMPPVAVAALVTFLVMAVLAIRSAPRGRRGR